MDGPSSDLGIASLSYDYISSRRKLPVPAVETKLAWPLRGLVHVMEAAGNYAGIALEAAQN